MLYIAFQGLSSIVLDKDTNKVSNAFIRIIQTTFFVFFQYLTWKMDEKYINEYATSIITNFINTQE